MKTWDEVTAEKLRGGFYTPDSLVDRCLRRVEGLISKKPGIRLLEPSAGDGAFIRGLARSALHDDVASVLALELFASEARLASAALSALPDVDGRVIEGSAIGWAASTDAEFDVVVGNPPFVRFQFIGDDDKASMSVLALRLGTPLQGVSNLWIPILLGSLNRLVNGGAFALIVPAECLTGISAGVVRRWLLESAEALRLDMFEPGSFPGVLQEVLILSGRRRRITATSLQTIRFAEHSRGGGSREWAHAVNTPGPWTRYLLEGRHVAAVEEARSLPESRDLLDVAKFDVAAVTGANQFFSVNAATVAEYSLARWAIPLLPRLRYAPGLIFCDHDYRKIVSSDVPAYLLDFSTDKPNPRAYPAARRYLASGERQGLPDRFKCRIREPWYRVPHIRRGTMMLSKRSNLYPRMVLNPTGAVTTDTIYRGEVRRNVGIDPTALVAAFHSSITMVAAELEGRSFGGGVLELVPSEVGRLPVVVPRGFERHLTLLDSLCRTVGPGETPVALIDKTDELMMSEGIGVTSELIGTLREAREILMRRRVERAAMDVSARLGVMDERVPA